MNDRTEVEMVADVDPNVPLTVVTPAFTEGSEQPDPAPLWDQTWRSFAYVMTCLFIMCYSLNYVLLRMPDPKDNPQLPDLGFDLFAPAEVELGTNIFLWCGNISLVLMLFGWFGGRQYMAVKWLHENKHVETLNFKTVFNTKYILNEELYAKTPYAIHLGKYYNMTFKIFTRYAQTYGCSCLMRVLSNLLTSLPTPNNQCLHPPSINHSEFLWNAVYGVLTFGSGNKHCGDLLYSGHSIVLTANFIALWVYGPLVTKWIRPWSLALVVGSWYTIVASRSHYSDDVLFAFYCTATMFLFMPEHLAPIIKSICYPTSPFRRLYKE